MDALTFVFILRFLVKEIQKEELKEMMKKIILSPWTLVILVALMVYGLFAMISGTHFFMNSPTYSEGMLIAAFGLGGVLTRHETFLAFIMKDLEYIKKKVAEK